MDALKCYQEHFGMINVQEIPKYTLKLSVDYINLYLKGHQESIRSIRSLLSSYGMRRNHYKVSNDTQIDEYMVRLQNNRSYKISLIWLRLNGYLHNILKIQHPDRILLEWLDHKISRHQYSINRIEFSFDFLSKNPDQLYEFLKNTLFIKWRGKKSRKQFETTTYLNDNRRVSSKGSKVYVKTYQGRDFVRFEMTLLNRYLKNTSVKCIKDLLEIDPELIVKHLEFKYFDVSYFTKRFFKATSGGEIDTLLYFISLKNVKNLIDSETLFDANKYALNFTKYNCLNKNEKFRSDFNKRFKRVSFFK
jgi:hypothetical protein